MQMASRALIRGFDKEELVARPQVGPEVED